MNITHAVAGIDPHKRTATVAVVDVLGVLVISLSFAVTESGVAELLALLKSNCLNIDRIGVEGSGGLGRPVMLALGAAGYDVREVQSNRAAAARRPMPRMPRQLRHSPIRTYRRPVRMPPRYLPPTNSTWCETGANRLCCNASGY